MKSKKLRLTELSKKNLSKRQMNVLKGGDWCSDKCGTSAQYATAKENDKWYNYFYSTCPLI